MLILPSILINSLLKRNKNKTEKKLSQKEINIIDNLNNMEFFDAIDYLLKLKQENK